MKAFEIAQNVYCLHADIQSDELFEGIWPIPQGVSLNSYLVRGEKIALIDFVRDWASAPAQLQEELSTLGLAFRDIDYLVLNHLEPDHTGYLTQLRALNPQLQIVSTAKGIKLVQSFYKLTDGLRAVANGETLDLGGRTLTFYETPNVHWPETMMTWDAASGTLFSCDAFGSFGALGDRVFDDQFDAKEHEAFEYESLRYYANIVSSFSSFVERAVDKLKGLDIRCVAPSHGIVWRQKPAAIIQRYLKYASYISGNAEKEICVVWGSMYGNTKAGLDAVLRGIASEGVKATLRRVPNEDVSWVLADAWKASGLVIAMPTYEYAMFPPMAYVLDIFRRKHVHGRKVLRIGSWGWVGGAKKEYEAAIESLKFSSLESLEWAGYPTADELAALEQRGRELARAVKA